MSVKGFKRVTASVPPNPTSQRTESDRLEPPPNPRRNPAVALAVAAEVAPTLPPTRVEALPPADPIAQLNLKVRASLIDQLAEAAVREGTTQKVIVCRALAAAGYNVQTDDLSDRGNHRRRRY